MVDVAIYQCLDGLISRLDLARKENLQFSLRQNVRSKFRNIEKLILFRFRRGKAKRCRQKFDKNSASIFEKSTPASKFGK